VRSGEHFEGSWHPWRPDGDKPVYFLESRRRPKPDWLTLERSWPFTFFPWPIGPDCATSFPASLPTRMVREPHVPQKYFSALGRSVDSPVFRSFFFRLVLLRQRRDGWSEADTPSAQN